MKLLNRLRISLFKRQHSERSGKRKVVQLMFTRRRPRVASQEKGNDCYETTQQVKQRLIGYHITDKLIRDRVRRRSRGQNVDTGIGEGLLTDPGNQKYFQSRSRMEQDTPVLHYRSRMCTF